MLDDRNRGLQKRNESFSHRWIKSLLISEWDRKHVEKKISLTCGCDKNGKVNSIIYILFTAFNCIYRKKCQLILYCSMCCFHVTSQIYNKRKTNHAPLMGSGGFTVASLLLSPCSLSLSLSLSLLCNWFPLIFRNCLCSLLYHFVSIYLFSEGKVLIYIYI